MEKKKKNLMEAARDKYINKEKSNAAVEKHEGAVSIIPDWLQNSNRKKVSKLLKK